MTVPAAAPQGTWSVVHLRAPEPDRFKSTCGLGYGYPSSIALTSDMSKVTCQTCFKTNAQ